MKIKTSELTGPALDWAVAKCEGRIVIIDQHKDVSTNEGNDWFYYRPSTDWALAGPIIENIAGFQLKMWLSSRAEDRCEAHIFNYTNDWISFGSTPLEAAMRCYVASKLGDEVEIPEELT